MFEVITGVYNAQALTGIIRVQRFKRCDKQKKEATDFTPDLVVWMTETRSTIVRLQRSLTRHLALHPISPTPNDEPRREVPWSKS